MNPLAFFRSPEVLRALRRACRTAAAPLSLHVFRDGAESPRVFSTGPCSACRYLAQHANGREACRASRAEHAEKALRRDVPVPFLCHMGFACVSVAPLRDDGQPYVVTLGPYCPAPGHPGASGPDLVQALERDAKRGLRALDLVDDEHPISVGDIAVVPADTVPAVAEWLADSLRVLWREQNRDDQPSDAAATMPVPKNRGGRAKRPESDPLQATDIAAAVLAGDRTRVRKLLWVVLGESRQKDAGADAAKARALAVAAAVLEQLALHGAGLSGTWEALARLGDAPAETEWDKEITRFVFTAKPANLPQGGGLVERVDHLVAERLGEAITLNEVAAALNVTPSAVTHALQRKFGMTFTQYVGRLRVDCVKELLRRTKLSTREIGLRVGIRDISNFNRLFKKFEGMTPTDYRKRYGAK